MGLIQENNDDIISGINITPLVDIMLVLLIIFMLVSSVVDFHAIKVELPHAASGEDINNETVSVMISQNGNYYLAGIKMNSFMELQTGLAGRKQQNPDIQIAISADKKTYHEEVVRVIDLVRRVGINRFAINVEQLDQSENQ
ncbi:MAG: biopolymer transporter ExbD [Desulfobacteraceae bacterium]|nr:MAG: biopolymer transporter ExbD [Desulfobacteraceae bacterium]